MSLIDLIQKPKNMKVATATVATPATDNRTMNSTVAKVASVAVANTADIEKVRAWLFKIGEPKEDHCIVLDKCKNDPEAMAYFLKHAKGEAKHE